MNLAALMAALPPKPAVVAFPQALLGAFRRKSITFCTGLTDEATVVYWFQSASFTLDLRLPDGAGTSPSQRQGWVGDTLWDEAAAELSWDIRRSYQPRNQWPEPARLSVIGNCVLEYAPSGAYVEDWRQQATRGPLLGLRLVGLMDETRGEILGLEGGLVVAGEHIACARSRLPHIDDALERAGSLEAALASGVASEAEIASYEVSVAIGGHGIIHSTQPERLGAAIDGDFQVRPDGRVSRRADIDGAPGVLLYEVDVFDPDFAFTTRTPCTLDARAWLEHEAVHLARHARVVL